MISFLKGLIQTAPLWSLSLMAFIPLTAKVLNENEELKPEVVSGIYSLAILSSLFLFLFLGFNDKEIFFLRFDNYGSGACVLAALSSLISLALFYLNSWVDKNSLQKSCFSSAGAFWFICFLSGRRAFNSFYWLEIASLMIYINLAMSRKDLFCLESAIKYLFPAHWRV